MTIECNRSFEVSPGGLRREHRPVSRATCAAASPGRVHGQRRIALPAKHCRVIRTHAHA